MNSRNLIPADKGDVETARLLFSYSYEDVQSIIPELLEWIQDMNWPVARPVADYLESILAHITTEILEILRGNDDIWKYWCIHVFGLWTEKEIAPELLVEIKRIVENPTETEIEEEVAEVGKEVLQENGGMR